MPRSAPAPRRPSGVGLARGPGQAPPAPPPRRWTAAADLRPESRSSSAHPLTPYSQVGARPAARVRGGGPVVPDPALEIRQQDRPEAPSVQRAGPGDSLVAIELGHE